jgi:nitrogen regulatory protein PII
MVPLPRSGHWQVNGHLGNGKWFVYDIQEVVKIRTGEPGIEAI